MPREYPRLAADHPDCLAAALGAARAERPAPRAAAQRGAAAGVSTRLRRAWHALDRREQAAALVWAVALLVLGGHALLRPYSHSVYPVFAGAARAWLAGGHLYATKPALEPYRYSPLVATLFVPLSLLPDGAAGLLWRLLGAAAFLGGLAWWCRTALPELAPARRGLLFLLPAPLAFSNLNNGQANMLVIGLLLIAVAAVLRERLLLAALCVALACLFKLYPIAVGLLLVALRPRRLGPRLALALAAGFLLPFVLQRPEYVAAQYGDWIRHIEVNDRQQLPQHLWYRDFRLLTSLWVAPSSYFAWQIAEVTGGLVVLAACLRARRAGMARPQLLTLALGLGCCWMTGLGPATESSTYVLLGPTAAWLVVEGAGARHPIGLRALWWCGYALLLGSQMAAWLPWGRAIHSLGPQPLAALLLLLGLLFVAFRAGSGARGASTGAGSGARGASKGLGLATGVAAGGRQ